MDESIEKNADMKRIVEREEPGMRGPWKWQLINLLTSIDGKLDLLVKADAKREAKAKAGKASAEARRKKYGSATPTGTVATQSGVRIEGVTDFQLNLIGPAGGGGSVPEQKPKRKRGQPTDGTRVWESYQQAFKGRHKVEPLRGARENRHCADLVRTLGLELAQRLVAYYVTRNDAFYVNAKHPLGLLVLNLQKINTEFQNGTQVTMSDARRIETHSNIDRAIRTYADQQEGVHEQEVEGVA